MGDVTIDTTKPNTSETYGASLASVRAALTLIQQHINNLANAHGIDVLLTSKADYEAHKGNSTTAHGLDTVNTNLTAVRSEVQTARGSKVNLDNRLGITLNPDGTLKLSSLANRYIDNGDVPTFISATSFSVPGDRTKVYAAGALIRATIPAGYVYGVVDSSVFGSSITTVTLLSAYNVLAAGLSKVEVALIALNNSLEASIAQNSADIVTLQSQYSGLSKIIGGNLITNSGFGAWSNATLENVGNDLITNGGFASDTTGWTPTRCTIASVAGGQSGNCLEMTPTSGTDQNTVPAAFNTTVGKLYRATVYVKSGTSGNEAFSIRASRGDTGAFINDVAGTSSGSWVQYSVVFEAVHTTSVIYLRKETATLGTMLFDTVACYEVTPGCVGANTLAMDGWAKDTGLALYREHNGINTKDGSYYAAKVVVSAAGNELYFPGSIHSNPEWYRRFASRTVTMGMWVKTSTANLARLRIQDSTGSAYSSYHTGGGAPEWLEVTRTINAATTMFRVKLNTDGGTGTVYISHPMLVFGSYIGAGNYASQASEVIWLDQFVSSNALNNKTGFSTVAATTLNVEADTNGKIPKGAKALYISANANDSGSAATETVLTLRSDSTRGQQWYCSTSGLANDKIARNSGWVACDVNGDIQYQIDASGAGTFDIPVFRITGVQL